jgi:D-alanyl-D-alanine dipeptidase
MRLTEGVKISALAITRLLVFDGYRPWSVTKVFWDAAPADKKEFVSGVISLIFNI